MGLSRSWSEISICGLEDLDGAFNNVFFHCFDSLTICFLCLVLNNPLHDAAENVLKRSIRVGSYIYYIEMANVSM